ncbi:MAG: DinB family protein [Caldilineaceae bacterium]
MKIDPVEIAKYLKILEDTPVRIATATQGCTEEELHSKSAAEGWSANDILAHLRACVDVWGKDMRTMLNEDTPRFRHLSPRTWLRKTSYPELPFYESFAAFTQARAELLALLRNLSLTDWSRAAIVKQNGKERTQTVFTRARQMAMHEEAHCAQIEALFKREDPADNRALEK